MTGALLIGETGRAIAGRVRRAIGPIQRTIGLLAHRSLDADEGLWFDHCSAIHTLGMRFPIDVLFLDGNGVVVAVEEDVRPGRLYVAARGARDLVELAAGACRRASVRTGMRLEIRWE